MPELPTDNAGRPGQEIPGPSIEEGSIFDTVQESTSARIVSLARRVDSFFGDPEYAAEEAYARASVEQTDAFYRNLDPEFRTWIRASVSLPNLCKRLRISFEGNDELYSDSGLSDRESTLADSTRQSLDAPSLRLQYFFLRRHEIDLRMSGGVRLGEVAFYAGPRLRLRSNIGVNWVGSFTQRVYWYATDNVNSKSELRFDHILGRNNLFRQAFRLDWDEEAHPTEGFRNRATASITQPVRKNAAFRYA